MYGAKKEGWKVDYQKLAKYLKERFKVDKILYYSGLDKNNKKQIKFYNRIAKYGYELKLVPVKVFKNGRIKADCDSRMTFEIMKMFCEYNNAIFFTGDGDFLYVLEYLKKETNKKIKLFSFKNITAKELINLFKEEFTDISRNKNLIKR